MNSGHTDRDREAINNNEVLRISFAQPFVLTAFTVSDLFDHESIDGGRTFMPEQGEFCTSGGDCNIFSGFDRKGRGEITVGFLGGELVNWIEFRAASPEPSDPFGRRNDFSLEKIEGYRNPAPVPEPASMLLLGTGLVGLAARLRRTR